MKPNDPKITVTGTNLEESAKAVKFKIDSIGREELLESITTWFPFSQIDKIYKNSKNQGEDYLIVSEWIMKQKELI